MIDSAGEAAHALQNILRTALSPTRQHIYSTARNEEKKTLTRDIGPSGFLTALQN